MEVSYDIASEIILRSMISFELLIFLLIFFLFDFYLLFELAQLLF